MPSDLERIRAALASPENCADPVAVPLAEALEAALPVLEDAAKHPCSIAAGLDGDDCITACHHCRARSAFPRIADILEGKDAK